MEEVTGAQRNWQSTVSEATGKNGSQEARLSEENERMELQTITAFYRRHIPSSHVVMRGRKVTAPTCTASVECLLRGSFPVDQELDSVGWRMAMVCEVRQNKSAVRGRSRDRARRITSTPRELYLPAHAAFNVVNALASLQQLVLLRVLGLASNARSSTIASHLGHIWVENTCPSY